MQQAIAAFAALETPGGTVAISLKVGIAAGPARRFLAGDPSMRRIDVLAGPAVDGVAQAEEHANKGQIVLDPQAAALVGPQLTCTTMSEGYAVVEALISTVPPKPWPPLPAPLDAEQLRPYLLSPVYQRLSAGQGDFLAELRPAVAFFLRFAGIDYHADDRAGDKLDAYVAWVQQVLARYDGHLMQISTGDKGSYLYISFGALSSHEDDAARAIAAAMVLRQPPPQLDDISGTQIGLSQGRVRTGSYGSSSRRTYAALGDEVNVAARLMQAAPTGEIRCSQHVYQAAGKRWAMEALPTIRLKGKKGPFAIYRPLRRIRETATIPTQAIVGRADELETQSRLLQKVWAGHGSVLILEGEAGIGKSCLVAELARQAQEAGLTCLFGAGQSIEQHSPYRAWRDILAALLGLDEIGDPAEQRRRVQEHLAQINPALAERAPLLNDILSLDLPETEMTRSFEPKLRHESLTSLVVDIVRGATTAAPLVLILEDAHWLDSLSWELGLAVTRALLDCPLLLVFVLRPLGEPLRPDYTALAGLAQATILHLSVMPAGETVALAAVRLGLDPAALPEPVAQIIREHAGGNPFFAEEMATALRDTGAVSVEHGGCHIGGDLDAFRETVPDTVEGVVLARIDRLPPEQQLTLKVAAVIGRSFLYRTLHDVHPQQIVSDLLSAYLGDLSRQDFTLPETLEPELGYVFKHIITQQVAYGTLLFSQRRVLHRTVAGWYERVYGDNLSPYYPLLVHHAQRAEDTERELHYARLAGEQAAAQFANSEAIRYLSRALELTPPAKLEQRYELLLAREQVYGLQGSREAQSQDLAALAELVQAYPDDCWQAEVTLRQAAYAEATSDYPTAVARAQTAAQLALSGQSKPVETRAYLRWGKVLALQGEYDEAWSRTEQALSLAREADLRREQAESLLNLDYIAFYQGHFAQARAYNEQALQIIREIGDRRGECVALNNLGNRRSTQGDYDGARTHYERALQISREIGSRRTEAGILANLGLSFVNRGDYRGAHPFYEQALQIYRAIGEQWGQGWAIGNLGDIFYYLGDYARARDYVQQCLDVLRQVGARRNESMTLASLGDICNGMGDYAGAQDYYEQGLAIMREIGSRRGETWALSGLGLLSHHLGDDQAAEGYSRQALQFAQELGDQDMQAYALTHLGHALAGLRRWDGAAEAYAQALQLRRELGQQNRSMETLAGLARVSLRQQDRVRALQQVEEILDHLNGGTLDGTEEPLRVYLTCYRVLQSNQDTRAAACLAASHALLQERTALIDDRSLRQGFLQNVGAHREIAAAYDELHG